jgi:glycosyltransferase involved in cell wall biosynthesis
MTKTLKIAIFCTNEWPTRPPQNTFYAPLWIAYYQAEQLAKKGHKVFYFGPKGTRLKYAKPVTFDMKAIKYNKKLKAFIPYINEPMVNFYEQLMVAKMYQMNKKEKFDIIHIHPLRRCIPFAMLTKTPTVVTLHDPILGFYKYMLSKTKSIKPLYLASISSSQRKPLPQLNYAGTVYNGLDITKYKFNDKPDDYFVAAGRFTPEKGIDIAIKAARKAKVRLKIAGGPAQGGYFENKIKPFLNKDIEYIGMLPFYKMGDFYRKAKGLLYPHDWEEPFGLVFIEAMACGTPVITFPKGSAKEIVKDKKTGFVVRNFNQMVKAIKKINQIKRTDCRALVEKKFTIEKMAESYEKTYYKILRRNKIK